MDISKMGLILIVNTFIILEFLLKEKNKVVKEEKEET